MKLDEEILGILSALAFPEHQLARIVEPLDRKLYKRIDAVLVALGGKWSRKDRAHVFTGNARSRIDAAITTGIVIADADLGHFPTPPTLATWLVQHAGVRPGHRSMEPSAGNGRIVTALLAAGSHVTAIERSPERREGLREMRSVLMDVPEVDDFMSYTGKAFFDRVVMNPPFCRIGIGDHLDHVRRALGMLAPCGILVSVLPSSLKFRRDRRHVELRELCESRGTITDLPSGSFRSSGTDVHTVAIRIEAKP